MKITLPFYHTDENVVRLSLIKLTRILFLFTNSITYKVNGTKLEMYSILTQFYSKHGTFMYIDST